jgi:hypothetical protein
MNRKTHFSTLRLRAAKLAALFFSTLRLRLSTNLTLVNPKSSMLF